MNRFLVAWTACQHLLRSVCARSHRRLVAQSGEGVISTAIAVLIMALIGAAMWVVFQTVFNDAGERIRTNVEQIQ